MPQNVESKAQNEPTRHYVYIVRCGDGSFYTGCTKNVEERVRRHNGELHGGARYTRTRRPVVLVHCEEFTSLREARRRERALKRLSRTAKELLIAGSSAGGAADTLAQAGGSRISAARKKATTRIDVDELYKKLRKPMPKPTVVHKDRKRYSRKQKHPRIPEEEE
ncbi:MAG: GIY-YIG nuclease family protein [Calditrichaeota bacterium]|nr:GIY-YIG nuclease family protein [Calditrichota bacterium]